MNYPNFTALISQFYIQRVKAIALMGSYARGDAGALSDINLLRFKPTAAEISGEGIHLIDNYIVVVTDVSPEQVDACFTNPDDATQYLAGLRAAKALYDPDHVFKAIQRRANEFVWDEDLQDAANDAVNAKIVSCVAAAQKGLEGLQRDDVGRMLNARHGLTWELANIMRVQKGILLAGANAAYTDVVKALGPQSKWATLSQQAFGLAPIELSEQIKAGLQLYALTFDLVSSVLHPREKALAAEIVKRIRKALPLTA